MNPTMKIVHDIGRMNFEGNIIPHNWYCNLKFNNGKPHVNACVLLSEIVYWYRPTIVKDEATGKVIEEKKKFKADKLQRSYASFADQFGFTKRQVKDALKFLEKKGVITLQFRHIDLPNGTRLANVLYIEPVVWMLHNITFQRHTCDDTTSDPLPFNGIDVTVEGQTNTDTTTETTTESTTEKESADAPTRDYLTDVFEHANGQNKEGIAEPENDDELWLSYRDQFLSIYKELTGLYPDAQVGRPAIVALAIEKNADPDLWQRVVYHWKLNGWNPRNIAGMIDCYQRGEVPTTGKGNDDGKKETWFTEEDLATSFLQPGDMP